MLALADCNSFYVSCERVFNPRLERKPVIILSSNDGSPVSRSMEAKALGVSMGEPWFKVKDRRNFKDVIALSSNFELYGEMSARVMRVLGRHAARQEVYSIDECFLDLSHVPNDELLAYAENIRAEVLQWVGIPVAIGLAPTKTLAKLAAERAKAERKPAWLLPNLDTDAARIMHVGAVWGIGPASARKLEAAGYSRVEHLLTMPLTLAAKLGGTSLTKSVAEVQGRSCMPLRADKRDPKQVISSRSFGMPVGELTTVTSAVKAFATKCAGRLQRHGMTTKAVMVYLVARFSDGTRSTFSRGHEFTAAVDDPALLQAVCQKLTAALYQPHLAFLKAGVMLLDLEPRSQAQSTLFTDTSTDTHAQLEAAAELMRAQGEGSFSAERLEEGNRLLAIDGVQPASELLESWRPRSEHLTQAFTTNWAQLPLVKALG